MHKLNSVSLKSICIYGGILRILMLIAVAFFSEDLSSGLLGSTLLNDDLRYLETAEMYSKSANFIIDVSKFKFTLDTIESGYSHDAFTSLWDWIVCILYYILRNEYLVKIVNILFAVVSVKCIYDICIIAFDKNVAKLASLLYAVLPYPIIFSCFLYKDQFYTMITLLLFRVALKSAGHIRFKDIVWLSLLGIASMLTRTGLVVLVIGAVIMIIFKQGRYKFKSSTLFFAIPLAVFVLGYVISFSTGSIERKMLRYVYEYEMYEKGSSSIIDYFVIKSPFQVYKYPLSLFFLLLQPLNLSLRFNCWMDLAGILNIVSVPLVIGNMFYLLNYKIKKSYLFWLFHAFYFVTIVTSLGIVRHQYYLQPFMMIIFALYLYNVRNRSFFYMSSIIMCLVFIASWFLQVM